MRITVVGDVLLDIDLSGAAERLSPDGPVPVIDVGDTEVRAGGAGLVARMLARDGVDVTLVTVLGTDERAGQLRAALDGIRVVDGPSGAPTSVKTRVRVGGHAVARLDEGGPAGSVPSATAAMLAAIDEAEAIVVADYGRGLTADPALRRALERRAAVVPVVWDPHPRGAAPVPGTAVATPNRAEARAFGGQRTGTAAEVAGAAAALRERWGIHAVVITMDASGALLAAEGYALPLVVPTEAVASADPCGAGDRLASSLIRELAAGAGVGAALGTAVGDAAAFLAAGGVGALREPVSPPRLAGADADAVRIAARVRAAGGTVVATGGCFDLLHAGHARTLRAARALGDCLVVVLNSDASVRRLKGAARPIMTQDDRVDLLLALECVDAVLVFGEDTPELALRRIEPEIWVKGGDYAVEDLPETAVLAEWGGRAVTVPFHPGRSTSGLASALAEVG